MQNDYSKLTDPELARLYHDSAHKSREQEAVAAYIFHNFQRFANTVASRHLHNPSTKTNHHDIDDIVSESFIDLFRTLERREVDDNFRLKPFIGLITRNKVKLFIKNKIGVTGKKPLHKQTTDDGYFLDFLKVESNDVPNRAKIDGGPSENELYHGLFEEVVGEIGQLPKAQRECITRRFIDGLDTSEIAAQRGTTEQAVKDNITKAKQRIRQKIKR